MRGAVAWGVTFHELETFILARMRETGLPGLSLALLGDGAVAYARGFGQRDIARGLPATPETQYSTGSITKSVTALAVMQLAERGLLDLEDRVARHLDLDLNPGGEPLQLRHLLTHTAGIQTSAYSESVMEHAHGLGGRPLPISGPRELRMLLGGAQDWSAGPPGRRYAYFNEGYALLGEVIERVSGQSYNDYVGDEILLPLGMTRSVFAREAVESDPETAIPYVLDSGRLPRPGRYLYRDVRSEGGLVSNVLDLLRYLSLYAEGGGGVLSEAGVAAMTTPRVPLGARTEPTLFGADEPAAPVAHYGYGLRIEDGFFGERLVSHAGSVLVATGFVAYMPARGVAVAVLANGSGYPLEQIGKAAIAALLGEDPAELPWYVLEDALRDLTGRYRSLGDVWDATVRRQGDFLLLELGGTGDSVILVPDRLVGDTLRFHTYSGGNRIVASFDRKGGAGNVELDYERYRFKRSGPL